MESWTALVDPASALSRRVQVMLDAATQCILDAGRRMPQLLFHSYDAPLLLAYRA